MELKLDENLSRHLKAVLLKGTFLMDELFLIPEKITLIFSLYLGTNNVYIVLEVRVKNEKRCLETDHRRFF
jgi:hypothetical protein